MAENIPITPFPLVWPKVGRQRMLLGEAEELSRSCQQPGAVEELGEQRERPEPWSVPITKPQRMVQEERKGEENPEGLLVGVQT